MQFEIGFPGGLRVDANLGGMTVRTDQPVQAGGDGSAPSPFLLFLASIGTCAGIYVLQFCRQRGISTEGVRVVEHVETDPSTHALAKVGLEIIVPPTFPEKYHKALIRSADLCAVKQTIQHPPAFETTVKVV